MKFKLPIIILLIFAFLFAVGTSYSTWTDTAMKQTTQIIQTSITAWQFDDWDFAKIGYIGACSFLVASQETSIVKTGNEAVRLTNTAGTQSKAHSFVVNLDRDYTVGEIAVYKVEFDYYHSHKREQVGKGFPKVQLLYNNSGKGNTQGGGDNVNNKSPFIATSIDEDWWHLEYFITALCPTMADHGDSPISTSQKINGIKITDDNIYDYNSNTAFIVVDNIKLSNTLSDRLGVFNRTSSVDRSKTEYFWFKIAWSGQLNSCVMSFSDPTVAEQDLASTKSPFYIHALNAGTTVVTATLDIGEDHQILTTSITLTVI